MFNYLCFIVRSCNAGYSGPACMPISTVIELREDFSQYPLNPSLWSTVSGNNGDTLSRCGRLTGKYSFIVICNSYILIINVIL